MVGRLILAAALLSSTTAQAQEGLGETVQQALCRIIDGAARERDVPAGFLTRLIWRESTFRTNAVSRSGAQGVAQFMPATARARGLMDPFDPEQAIPHAAHLIADLRRQFGNLGLAAAAYNGGPARVASWLSGGAALPDETRAYVAAVSGRDLDEWRGAGRIGGIARAPRPKRSEATRLASIDPAATLGGEADLDDGPSCVEVTAGLAGPARIRLAKAEPALEAAIAGQAPPERGWADPPARGPAETAAPGAAVARTETTKAEEAGAEPGGAPAPDAAIRAEAALAEVDHFALPPEGGVAAPWGIQLAGSFSKEAALAAYQRSQAQYADLIGEARPMVIGTRLLHRGYRNFYRVRIPAESRDAADGLCGRIREVGGACVVLRT